MISGSMNKRIKEIVEQHHIKMYFQSKTLATSSCRLGESKEDHWGHIIDTKIHETAIEVWMNKHGNRTVPWKVISQHLGRKYGTHGTKRTVTVRFGNARYETHGGGGATVRSAVRSAVRSCATRALPCVLGGNQNARRLAPSIWRTLEMRRHLLHVIQCYKSKHSRLALTNIPR